MMARAALLWLGLFVHWQNEPSYLQSFHPVTAWEIKIVLGQPQTRYCMLLSVCIYRIHHPFTGCNKATVLKYESVKTRSSHFESFFDPLPVSFFLQNSLLELGDTTSLINPSKKLDGTAFPLSVFCLSGADFSRTHDCEYFRPGPLPCWTASAHKNKMIGDQEKSPKGGFK